MKDWSADIERLIRKFLQDSPDNSLMNEAGDKAWDNVLIGFSKGSDPLYQFYKEDIGQFYWTPPDIFSITFPHIKVQPDELTVISWILPQTKITKADNRKESTFPAERWVRSRNYGEIFNGKLALFLAEALRNDGIDTVAPGQSPQWSMQVSERYGLASNWSERHTAYVSGLGTFSLCDGLITAKGKAMRCGSVVARISLPPSVRQYEDYHGYCLFYQNGKCKKCISRCPCGAITEFGHDKSKCRAYLFETLAQYAKSKYGIESYGCGLCQTKVPCESGIPLRSAGK